MPDHRFQPSSSSPSHRLSADQAVQRALVYLAEHRDKRVTLNELAEQVGMTGSHLQRTFTRLVGMSPKMYCDALRIGLLKPHGVNGPHEHRQVMVDYVRTNTASRDSTVHSAK